VINSLGQSILTGVRRLAHWLVGENFTPWLGAGAKMLRN
jgi:hypothetical protein